VRNIHKVAVLGAGTMGARIAAHLADASVPSLLLDIVPKTLTPDEQAKGLRFDSPSVRNRLARAGVDAALKSRPAAFFVQESARLITPGNFEDRLSLQDSISMNRERLISDAKQVALDLVRLGYRPGLPRKDIRVLGQSAFTNMKLGLHLMRRAEYVSEYDVIVATQLAKMLSGARGD
jgi:3-hydroxyacyl-CoA dehydrogenase